MSIAAGEYVAVSTLHGLLVSRVSNPRLSNILLCVWGYLPRWFVVPEAHDVMVAGICVILVLRVPFHGLMALASSCFRCNVVGSLLLSSRLPGRAFCCCAF